VLSLGCIYVYASKERDMHSKLLKINIVAAAALTTLFLFAVLRIIHMGFSGSRSVFISTRYGDFF
jgi:hypothetical protein